MATGLTPNPRTAALAVAALIGSIALTACGGGSSSSSPPAPSTFTIGGSVSGLTASGLVLVDNGGDALTVPALANSFTFATPVSSGGAYAVTVQTQPTGVNCTVTNASGMASANVTSVAVSCASRFAAGGPNVVPITVEQGVGTQTPFDEAYTSVKVCQGSSCVTINNVEIDTGSSGLRLMASALTSAGLTPTLMADPIVPGNTLAECFPTADQNLWGPLAQMTISIGGETSGTMQVQVIDDNGSFTGPPAGTPGCANTPTNPINAIAANGILGVGLANEDCGQTCANGPTTAYWTCTTTSCTEAATMPLADQVANPAAGFPTDNNGIIVQLPAVPPGGAATASGYLVFGIGTEGNNAINTSNLLTATTTPGTFGQITTTYNGTQLPQSFIDSGSDALFFNDSSLTKCASNAAFYCPASTVSLSAVNQGQNGVQSSVAFQIANLSSLSTSNYALNDVGGPAPPVSGWSYFDWGMPFFFGRTIYFGMQTSSQTPYYAY